MAKKSRTKLPPIAWILIGAIFFLGIRLVINYPMVNPEVSSIIKPQSLSSRFSLGENLLIAADATEEKQKGVAAFAQGNNQEAIAYFQQSLLRNPNDPETAIYLENAKLSSSSSQTAAAVVPIGSNLDVAQEMLRGVSQAQQEFNSQGGNLQIKIVNDENNAEITKQVAQELVNDQSVLAVIGSNASNASLAAAPIYQNAGLVMITPTSTAKELSNFGNYIFRAAPTNNDMAEALAEYAVKTARKKDIAVCYDSQAPDNLAFKDEFIPALIAQGGNLINISCDLSVPDFNPENAISSLISSGAEAVLIAPHIDRLNRAIDLARANQWKMLLLGTFSLDTKQITESGQGDLNGVVIPVPFHYQLASAQPFANKALRLWGINANWRTASSYDATQAIIEGLRQNDSRDGLQATLFDSNFSALGANGNVEFLTSGDRVIEPVLVKVKSAPEKGYYFELLSTQ